MRQMYSKELCGIALSQVLLNECRVYGTAAPVAQELKELQALEQAGQGDAARSLLTEAVLKLSHGRNTVLYDDAGVPAVMVRIPAMTCRELVKGCCSDDVHPAFRLGNKRLREVWVSKYLNCVVDGRAASLPMSVPANVRNLDQALSLIRPKGKGWLLMPFSLHMAIVLKCHADGREISGNTDKGHDYYAPEELGVVTDSGTVLTGSGPLRWSHNGRPDGLWDLVGNLNEWNCGFRLVDGEIQLMDMEALVQPHCDMSAASPLWHAMDESGASVPPGVPGTLHFDGCDGAVCLTKCVAHHGLGNCAFCDVSAAEGIAVPEELRLLGLYPPEEGLGPRAGWRWISTEGECVPLCGGAFRIADHSGMFFMGVTKPRDVDYALSGMRCVYIPEDAAEEEEP